MSKESDFTVFEGSVAAMCGVSRDKVRDLRLMHLIQGADWDFVKKRACYSDAGVARMKTLVMEGDPVTVSTPEVQGEAATHDSTPVKAVVKPAQTEKMGRTWLVVLPDPWQEKIFNDNLMACAPLGVKKPRPSQVKLVKVKFRGDFEAGQKVPVKHLHGPMFALDGSVPNMPGLPMRRKA